MNTGVLPGSPTRREGGLSGGSLRKNERAFMTLIQRVELTLHTRSISRYDKVSVPNIRRRIVTQDIIHSIISAEHPSTAVITNISALASRKHAQRTVEGPIIIAWRSRPPVVMSETIQGCRS